ncbi:hypothetical protein HZC53_00585 [Candidatus Uhrbacteria bacterium]|nr:hypothetical protein [Candidatus Uhrbacteria bacterium]
MAGYFLLEDFANACLVELEARLGSKLTMKKGLLLDPLFNRERFALAIKTLADYATADKQLLFDPDTPDVTPAHVVDLLLACDPNGGEIEHLASCCNCLQRILDLYGLFFMILEGMSPEDVQEIHSSKRFRAGLYSFIDSLDCTKRKSLASSSNSASS